MIEVELKNGTTLTDRRTVSKGDPGDPLTRTEIQDKLRTAAAGHLASAKVERVIGMVDRLEDLGNTAELLAALQPG